ncbi:MAG: NADP-specific glutamate dehydrogenase [Oligoflexia bacterium]|nr:NADP-specific glutamate dehydrogenase [Oligoflexia bacterium]MBF0363949.1 NADP-specific glutamate dehydrogenase [Oligoflexia bacterium]
MSSYALSILNSMKQKYPWEQEFLQSLQEVFNSIAEIVDREPVYRRYKILERIVEPERVVTFKVPWKDDCGEIHVNNGHRVAFNSALGPYKGGLRFHSSVNLSILKCLAFEQIFKNSLTGLPMGGGKGGSDFSPRGKSDLEIMSFCQSFMTELYRHIGAETDIPAGDIGVGGREIGYLFGQYKRITNTFNGVLTGKGVHWGGSYIRPEATGYGLVYFVEEILRSKKQSLVGKIVAVSGFGNVAWGAVKKATQLGGKVVTLSGPDGFIYDPEGVGSSEEKLQYMIKMRLCGRDQVSDYATQFKVQFYPNMRPWGVKCDIALPCATQNELSVEDALMLVQNKVFCVAEGANVPCTLDAASVFQENKVLFAPGKAANAGGVACSGLEMGQNSMHLQWAPEEVDQKLKFIMKNIHRDCFETAEQIGKPYDYVAGANICSFRKVAGAMLDQGIV